MAELGYEVLGMDVDAGRIAALAAGTVPFYEPGLDELLAKHVASGALRFTTSYADVAGFGADVHFICVNTPQRKGEYAADLRYVEAVVEGLAPYLDRPTVIAGKSTVPAGTAVRLAQRLAELSPAGTRDQPARDPEIPPQGCAARGTPHP